MSLFLVKNCLQLVLLVVLVSAQDFRTAGVNQHNIYRAKHSSPNISGVQSVHQSAQQWSDYLASTNQFKHSGGKYGENIYKAWGGSKDLSERVKDAITSWYGEISKYNFNKPGYQASTGHFTQVVWKASTQLGIGASIAADSKYGHSITIVAQYNPAGNIVTNDGSYFRANVLPPK